MRFTNYETEFIDEADSYSINNKYKFKKVESKSVEDDRYKESLHTVLCAIDRINTIKDRTQKSLDGVSLNDIEIPSAFAKVLLPLAVYVDTTDENCNDLLQREGIDDTQPIDWEDFETACKNVVAHFRNGKVWTKVPLKQLKKVVALNDVIGTASVKGGIWLTKQFNWLPTPLIDEMSVLFEDQHWNGDLDAYMKRYVKQIVIPFWRGDAQNESE